MTEKAPKKDEHPTSPLANSQILDLDLIVTKWLDFMQQATRPNCFSGFFRRAKSFELADLDLELNWANVKFTQEQANFTGTSTTNKLTKQTLFQSSFDNRTSHVQETCFRVERETTQSYALTFSKGWSRQTQVGLKVPFLKNIIKLVVPVDVLEFSGGLTKEIHAECGQDTSQEEKIQWRCDTKVNVGPLSKVTASLRITELEMEKSFSGVTFIEGRLVAVLSHPKYGFVNSYSGSVFEIVQMALEKGWVPARSEANYVLTQINERRGVRACFGGVCKFRLGFDQVVEIQEEKIEE